MVTKAHLSGDEKVASAAAIFRRRAPWRFRDVVLDKIDPDLHSAVVAAINDFAKPTQERRGLLLSGDVGVGKTAALWVLIKYYYAYRFLVDKTDDDPHGLGGSDQWNENPSDTIFISHFELSRLLRDFHGGDHKDDGHPDVYWRSMVVIDDLGTRFEDRAGWNVAIEYGFFNERWEYARPLYCSTNKTLEQLRKTDGWARIADRLADPSWTIAAGTDRTSMRTGNTA